MPSLDDERSAAAANPTEAAARFAGRLRELVAHAGLSQRDLARLTGISKSTIHDAVSGKSFPAQRTVLAIVKACGAPEQSWHDEWGQINLARMQPSQPPPHPERQEQLDTAGNSASPARPATQDSNVSTLRSSRRYLAVTLTVAAMLILVTPSAQPRSPQPSDPQPDAASPHPQLVALRQLYNHRTRDSLLTTESKWPAQVHETATDGYEVSRSEGWVLAPDQAPPPCMIPLVRFLGVQPDSDHHPDHATTADPAWINGAPPAGYQRQATVGYIYPYQPGQPAPPGTLLLVRSHSPNRGYLTTAAASWTGKPGDHLPRGYSVERYEGYILAEPTQPPLC